MVDCQRVSYGCYDIFAEIARCVYCVVFFFKQKTAYEMRISDWSSDVCSSDLRHRGDQAMRGRDSRPGRRNSQGRESGLARVFGYFKSWFKDHESPPSRRNRAHFKLRGRLQLVGGPLGLCSVALVGPALAPQRFRTALSHNNAETPLLPATPNP